METENPGDVDDDEAEVPTTVNKKLDERVQSKLDAFAFTTNSNRDSGG